MEAQQTGKGVVDPLPEVKQSETPYDNEQKTQNSSNVVGATIRSGDNSASVLVVDEANLGSVTDDEISQSVRDWNPNPRFVADKGRVDSVADSVPTEPDSVVQPQIESSNATNATTGKCHTSNATNATMQPEEVKAVAVTQNPVVAVPNEWGKLWRIEKNGRYYVYRLRFHPDRITKPGGKITAAIDAKCHNRKGKGRHKESREEATRLRGRAFDIADRLQ